MSPYLDRTPRTFAAACQAYRQGTPFSTGADILARICLVAKLQAYQGHKLSAKIISFKP